MHFNFSTFNHCPQGQIIVEDITHILGHQLIALGHTISWSNDGFYPRGAYNVVLESFADPNYPALDEIRAAHERGCQFLCVATEEPTGDGFNHGLDPAMIDRQKAFPEAARYFDGILHLIPGEHITQWYGQFGPAAHAELGYAPGLVVSGPEEPNQPAMDFGFYGKMTWRREQMLGHLEQLTGRPVLRITSLDVPRAERDRYMRCAKVIVQIRANEEWGMVSSTRCASALHFGRPVVAEPHPDPGPWEDVVHFAKSVDAFYADAIEATRAWKLFHYTQVGAFRAKLTPEHCVGRALREIGIT